MNNLFSLNDKVAVVTGALGLIGRQHCRALAAAGANVVVTDIDGERCEAFANALMTEYPGINALGTACDITDEDDVGALLHAVLGRFGSVNILVNNAAVNDMVENPAAGPELSCFENYPLAAWKRSLDVNVTGTFLCSRAIGSHMATNGGGSIINIASTYGIVAPDQSLYRNTDGSQIFYKSAAYPTSKGAVLMFTRFLASYWGRNGVRVNALSPGGVQNGQDEAFIERYALRTPLGRMADARDYQGALVFLASDASGYVTGANLVVDGGWTIW